MPAITELASAKVNLTLKVRGRRPDGYHAIESLIAFAADVGDVVRLEPGAEQAVRVTGPFAGAIVGPNLVATALARLADASPQLALGGVTLEKRLPVAAGIGGGSADAAALLRAVRRANPALAGTVDWAALAASLGADVPVCLEVASAFVWGAGERIAALPGLPRLHAVLVNPLAAVPADKTAQVFGGLAAPPATAPAPPPAIPGPFADAAALLGYMRAEGNDLVTPAAEVVPQIASVQAALSALPGCLYAGLSGAGPTSYAIFATAQEAGAAAVALCRDRPDWWVEASVLGR